MDQKNSMNQCHFLAAYQSTIHGAAIDENENYEQWVAEQGNVQLGRLDPFKGPKGL